MRHPYPARALLAAALMASLLAAPPSARAAGDGAPWRGANLIATPDAPLGGPRAGRSLARLRELGADAVALVPFLWQPAPGDPRIVNGSAVPLAELRAGIRQARALGFRVLVKPHVWVPGTWAGAVSVTGPDDVAEWFARYGLVLEALARIAAEEGAEAFAVGTELVGMSRRPEWRSLIARIRAAYGGTLTYVAHWDEEFARIGFWDLLDVASVSLYPPLGPDGDPDALRAAVEGRAALLASQAPAGRRVWVAELGLRSAAGAQEKPWESAEERDAEPDEAVQATVLALWRGALRSAGIEDVLVWRWFTDPEGGGPGDTDFTVQGKRAEAVVGCWFSGSCDPLDAATAPR